MTGMGMGMGMGISRRRLSAEARKARACPVTGAVVIAPLTQSVRNYGSLGGSFTAVGNPVIGGSGATFDGVDDGLYLDSGYSAEFTLVSRIKFTALTTAFPSIVSAMNNSASSFGGWGVGVRSSAVWYIDAIGVGSVASTVARDTSWHTATIVRTGGVASLYIDGSFAISTATGNTGGTRMVFGGIWYNGSFAYPVSCSVATTTLYHSALSVSDQAAVEAYVAAA